MQSNRVPCDQSIANVSVSRLGLAGLSLDGDGAETQIRSANLRPLDAIVSAGLENCNAFRLKAGLTNFSISRGLGRLKGARGRRDAHPTLRGMNGVGSF